MKKLTLVLASVFAMAAQSMAHGNVNINSYADAFVFDEMGITFSVYPDGEFDFYLPNQQQSTTVSNGFVNVTFNSGYDYNPYIQYDDFGAVIQVENVPIWYDAFGRVDQIGDVRISYRNRRVCQVGGLHVYYNTYGGYAYHTGFINTWNPYFVYRPFYSCFTRPAINLCFVRTVAYRQYYTPVRYAYYRPYMHNVRPCYATVGHTYRPQGYGQAHHRYTQTASAGERPVTRERQTVTTERARAQYPELARTNAVDRNAIQDRGAYTRSNPATNNSGRTISAANDRNVNASSRQSVVPNNERTISSQRENPTMQSRPAQVVPSRGGSSNVQSNSVDQSRSRGDNSQFSRPSSPVQQSAPSRGTVNNGSVVSRGSSNASPSRGNVNQTSSRNVPAQAPRNTSSVQRSQPSTSSVSRQAPSTTSRLTVAPSSSKSGSGAVSKPSRSVSPASAPSKSGGSSNGSMKRGG